MKTWLNKHWPQAIITLVVVIIAFLNYKAGTFLSGWDTLHPEFNFGLNFQRLLSVWHSEQGLGALPGHSQMADLPRVVILWLLHFILPLNTLRYFYIFINLLLGPLGVYALIKYLFSRLPERSEGLDFKRLLRSTQNDRIVAFLTALFYLFNLSTLQQFFVPFEMFTVQYAFLPWIILLTLKYLQGGRKTLLLFSLITLLATPQAYAAHLWYAFFGTYALFLVVYIILGSKATPESAQRDSGQTRIIRIKRSVILIVLTLLINSFWLLPNLYYIFTSSTVNREAKQNRLYSQEYGLRNRENGYLADVALGKGFYFNWTVYNFQKNRFEYLMYDWRQYLNNPIVAGIGYLLFVGVILGIILSFLRKNKTFLSLFPFFILPFIFLMNHTFPFDRLFNWLLSFKLLEEALRFVFTKFSILLIFSYALYLALFLRFISEKITRSRWLFTGVLIFIAGLIIYSFPFFQGRLISDKVRIKIPAVYWQMWDFMNKQPDGTVLSLPVYNFAGWNYYRWGYQGSGFIWFGLKQPILDRDSDRWSVANEQAFREFHFAIYSRSPQDFVNDLKKYNIQYILWDQSVITYNEKNRPQILYQREIQALIKQLEKDQRLSKIGQFGKLQIFKYRGAVPAYSQIIYPQANLQPYRWGFNDYGYESYGNYLTVNSLQTPLTVVYPYRSMIEVSDRVGPNKFNQFSNSGKSAGTLALNADALFSLNKNRFQLKLINDNGTKAIYLKTNNFQNGINLDLSGLPHTKGYFVTFTSKNLSGMPLRFCLLNLYSNLCTLYDELSKNKQFGQDYFYLPPSENSLGYNLSIDNISYGNYDAINELAQVKITEIDSDIMALKTMQTSSSNQQQAYLLLRQSYQPGWKAYQNGKELTDHVLIDNWANGWKLDSPSAKNIVMIFWPQYLEYVGFGLLTLAFIVILVL